MGAVVFLYYYSAWPFAYCPPFPSVYTLLLMFSQPKPISALVLIRPTLGSWLVLIPDNTHTVLYSIRCHNKHTFATLCFLPRLILEPWYRLWKWTAFCLTLSKTTTFQMRVIVWIVASLLSTNYHLTLDFREHYSTLRFACTVSVAHICWFNAAANLSTSHILFYSSPQIPVTVVQSEI